MTYKGTLQDVRMIRRVTCANFVALVQREPVEIMLKIVVKAQKSANQVRTPSMPTQGEQRNPCKQAHVLPLAVFA